MKEIIVKSYNDIEPKMQNQNGNKFVVKNVIPQDISNKCRADFVEVEPGNYAYSYHYHEVNEEVFYIISGEALVKTEDGDVHLKQGDIICFPANEKGSHVISNPSKTEKLVYLDVGSANIPDVAYFTGTDEGIVATKSGMYRFSK